MWWNNVETKPGTGYPTKWEDQLKFKGGWVSSKKGPRLRLQNRATGLASIFFNPSLPSLDDYYEPWTYKFSDLFDSPQNDDQPTARPISLITDKPLNIETGPNWDDDLSGSPIYAANDPNFQNISKEEQNMLFQLERMFLFYLPRICNHCLNPACSAACPAGAIYKRGEDGIVLASQDKCRGWRMCISGCPYKKVYYNWSTGKAEKCILCFPRQETGQAPACFHSCVGRIRYLGILLYNADRIKEVSNSADDKIVDAQRDIILDPTDPEVISKAKENNIDPSIIINAQKSPVYFFVKKSKLALPLHPEFRTLPMLFYIPPLLPLMASVKNGSYKVSEDFFSSIEGARIPTKYLSGLLSAGNEKIITDVYKKLVAVRFYKRSQNINDISSETVRSAIENADLSIQEIEEIYHLTSIATIKDRFVIPSFMRETTIETVEDPYNHKGSTGIGPSRKIKRGW
jgi:nitrate reductase beta subunit